MPGDWGWEEWEVGELGKECREGCGADRVRGRPSSLPAPCCLQSVTGNSKLSSLASREAGSGDQTVRPDERDVSQNQLGLPKRLFVFLFLKKLNLKNFLKKAGTASLPTACLVSMWMPRLPQPHYNQELKAKRITDTVALASLSH